MNKNINQSKYVLYKNEIYSISFLILQSLQTDDAYMQLYIAFLQINLQFYERIFKAAALNSCEFNMRFLNSVNASFPRQFGCKMCLMLCFIFFFFFFLSSDIFSLKHIQLLCIQSQISGNSFGMRKIVNYQMLHIFFYLQDLQLFLYFKIIA